MQEVAEDTSAGNVAPRLVGAEVLAAGGEGGSSWLTGDEHVSAETSLLCRRHHCAVHDEGFSMALAPDGEARSYRPDGRPVPEAPTLPRAAAPLSHDSEAGGWEMAWSCPGFVDTP